MNNINNAKAFSGNEAIKKQIAKIINDGNRPEDWKSYIDGIKSKAHDMDESKRNMILMYWYCNAFKSIPQTSKSPACAQMLVDYAWIKSQTSMSDAQNLLSFGRSNLRHFAIIHIASAELFLKAGDMDKAKKLIKSAYSHGAEPVSLIKEAAKRLCLGHHQLISDEDCSSSSGHESSEPEISGEYSNSFIRNFGHKQEHSSSNFPGLKYDTEELQEGFDLLAKIREPGNDTRTKDDNELTSPLRNSHAQENSPTSSPVMPKTPKTPAFSSQSFKSIFNSKRQVKPAGDFGGKQDPSGMGDHEPQLGIDESHKALRENSGLLNLVTPCVKSKTSDKLLVPSAQKLGRNSSVSKLRNFALQPPRRVKVDNSSKVIDDEDEENDCDEMSAHMKESSQKLDLKSVPQGLFATPASKSTNTKNGNLTSDSVQLSIPFANTNTYSVHKTTNRQDNASNTRDVDIKSTVMAAPVERKLFKDEQAPTYKQEPWGMGDAGADKARDGINVSCDENPLPVPRNGGPEFGGSHLQNDQRKAQQKVNVMDVGISSDRRVNPQQLPVMPQAINPPVQQPPPSFQNGQKLICVSGKPYIVTRLIGRGGSAKVYQVQDPETFEMKALKSVNLSGASHQILDSYKNEIALLKKLQGCDCVIRLYDSEYDPNKKKLLVVMEFGETDLANFVAKNGSIKNQDELYPITVCYLWGNMVKAVRAMHKEGVVHSDLKPANFILVSGNIKLIDFGIANSIQQDKTSMLKDHKVGTPSYMSPEALMANDNTDPSEQKPMYKIGFKSDVWSLGCILYQMVYGQTPFYNCRYKLEAIVNPAHVIKFPPTDDAALTDILMKCLTRNVKERPTTDDLMVHPYLTKQRTVETPVKNDPISNLMSEGASIASASPRSQQAFCLKFQKAMELMNSTK